MKITQTGNGKVEIDVEGDTRVAMLVYKRLEDLQREVEREGVK